MKQAMQAHKQANKGKIRGEVEAAYAELNGHITMAEGRVDKGLKQLAIASGMQSRLNYNEPPLYPRPVAEALGFWAMRHGKTSIAEKAFQDALTQYPADYHAQTGLRTLRTKPIDAGL